MVQQKLCTEPEDNPQEQFGFAIAYEEGVSQHQQFESGGNELKNDPVLAVTERKNPCTRCGLDFSENLLAVCNAKNQKCRNCATIGHYAQTCERPKTGKVRGRSNFAGRAGIRRINLIFD